MRHAFSFIVFLSLLLAACIAAPAAAPAAETSAAAASTAAASGTLSAVVSATFAAVRAEAGLSSVTPDPTAAPAQPAVVLTATPAALVEPPPEAGQDFTRTDSQGAVTVEVTPNNLQNPGETIDFEVGFNTHSVNLNMDLAKLAMLQTDTGRTARASAWDGMAGGHHVSGNLSFPAQVDGKPLLQGANVLTLVIQNVAAPERTFTWNLHP